MVSTLLAVEASELGDGKFDLGVVDDAAGEIARGNPNLIWGWKRDVGIAARAVYFGGELEAAGDHVLLTRWYLFYRHRAEATQISAIADLLSGSSQLARHVRALRIKHLDGGIADLRLELGHSSAPDRGRVRRLQLRRPRRRLPDVTIPRELPPARAFEFLPADLYVGSGISYEAGLPTLCDMHLAFGVDNAACTQFAVGEEDLLPLRLASDLPSAIGSFCAVHVGALRAAPTHAMNVMAQLKAEGQIRRVFTDNVDNLLSKVGIPFERTRGTGVFNEVYPATFDSGRLIVIGVAADRRSLIKQARAKGMEIVTVNPCEKVAPMVRHLDYIRSTDPFFRMPADTFFRRLTHADARPAGSRMKSVEAVF